MLPFILNSRITSSTWTVIISFFTSCWPCRMGIAAPGDRIPGNIPLPSLDPVPPAPALSSFQNCHLGLPLADFQDHARSGEWEFVFCFLELTAAGMSHPSWELPQSNASESVGLGVFPVTGKNFLLWFAGSFSSLLVFVVRRKSRRK